MYTLKTLANLLIEKGHSRQYAEEEAAKDLAAMNAATDIAEHTQQCSVCCFYFTDLQWKYHYHPCE